MTIPVIFAFDENYALPASVAIRSLVETKSAETDYEIVVLHGGLNRRIMRRMETVAPIRWVKVDRHRFVDYPKGWSGEATWYRLLLGELLPEYDRVIWSDVDVLFRRDLSSVFTLELGDADWAGVPEEKNSDGSMTFIPSLMVVPTKRWREMCFFYKCEELIHREREQLTMYDLDVLNRLAKRILPLSPDWCVFERLPSERSHAPEYGRMAAVHGQVGLDQAISDPSILHYAGPPIKVWLRSLSEMPSEYRKAVVRSPFWDPDREKVGIRSFAKLVWHLLAYVATRNIAHRRMVGIYRRTLSHFRAGSHTGESI